MEHTKRSTLEQNTQGTKTHTKQPKSKQTTQPRVSIGKFAVLARARLVIKNNPQKYKGLYSHANSQFNNYAREIENSGRYTRAQLHDAYDHAKTNDDPNFLKRVRTQIERYKFRQKAIKVGTGIATGVLVGGLALSTLFGSTKDTETELPDTTQAYEQQYENPEYEDELEFEYEAQPELSAEQFAENYRTGARQQTLDVIWSIQFFEGTQAQGHQTVSRTDGMSFGKIQHNFAPGAETANDFLRIYIRDHRATALAVFGARDLATLEDVLKKSPTEIQQFTIDNYDYWMPIFRDKLLTEPVFIAILDADAEVTRMLQAHALCERHDLNSALALEYAYNSVVLTGRSGARNNFAILDTVNREQVTPEFARAYLENKFATRFANRDDIDQFMNAKRELINSLSDMALFDYYYLNIIEDQAPGPLQATRSKSILGLGAKHVNGTYQHGYDVYRDTWFAPDLTKLEQQRMPETEQGLAQALYNAGYSLDDNTQIREPAQNTNDLTTGN